jgi:hypothetical protein
LHLLLKLHADKHYNERNLVTGDKNRVYKGVEKQWPQPDRGRTGTSGDHKRPIHEISLHLYPIPIEPVLLGAERRVPIQTSEFHSEIPEAEWEDPLTLETIVLPVPPSCARKARSHKVLSQDCKADGKLE